LISSAELPVRKSARTASSGMDTDVFFADVISVEAWILR